MTNVTISNILFVLAGILWSIELIPQIIKTIKTKSVNDISPFFFSMCFIAYIFYLIGAILINNWALITSNLLAFSNLIVMLVLIFKYKKKK